MMPEAEARQGSDTSRWPIEQCWRTELHESHPYVVTPWRTVWCAGLDGSEASR